MIITGKFKCRACGLVWDQLLNTASEDWKAQQTEMRQGKTVDTLCENCKSR